MDAAKLLLQSEDQTTRSLGVRMVQDLAGAGDALATYAVGTWHLHGVHGFTVDTVKATECFKIAAENLIPEALFDLGQTEEILATDRNRNRRAFGNYVVAAILGDLDALEEVQRCFYWGKGTFADRAVADLLDVVLEQRRAERQSSTEE
jgi:TPR repeat protein